MGLLHQHGKRPDGVREKASVLLLEDYDGHVFGVYTAFNWTSNSYDKFFGTEESFLFSLKPEACLYDYDGSDNNVMIADEVRSNYVCGSLAFRFDSNSLVVGWHWVWGEARLQRHLPRVQLLRLYQQALHDVWEPSAGRKGELQCESNGALWFH